MLLATVANPNPDEVGRRIRTARQMEEVLILADENHLVLGGITPYFDIRRLTETYIQDVGTRDTHIAQEACQRCRELIVDQVSH